MGGFSDLDIERQNRASARLTEAQLIFRDVASGKSYAAMFMLTPDGGAFQYPLGFQEIPFGTPLPVPFPEEGARELCEAAIVR